MSKRRSGLDTAGIKDPVLKRVLDRVVETLRVYNGEGRKRDERVVTFKDLSDGSLALRVRSINGADADRIAAPPAPLGQRPGPPTGVQAMPTYNRVVLDWDTPSYRGHRHAEIWRHTDDDLGAAQLVGTAAGRLWVDSDVEAGREYFYWLRFVGTVGEGPFHATEGLRVVTTASVEHVRDALTAVRWQPGTVYGAFQVVTPAYELVRDGVVVSFQATVSGVSGAVEPDWSAVSALGDTIVDGSVTWQAVDIGTAPFVIGEVHGRPTVLMHGAAIKAATIENAAIKSMAADKLFATSGSVFELLANSADIHQLTVGHNIQSANYAPGSSGWRIAGNGSAEFRNIIARGDVEASSIKANAANIIDTLHIRGQAVTFADRVFSVGQVSAGSSRVNIQSITLNTTGAPLLIIFSFYADTVSTPSSGAMWAYVRLLRDGVDISGDMFAGYWFGLYSSGMGFLTFPWYDTPSAGNHTYTVQARADRGTYGFSHRGIYVQELKR